MTAILRRIDKPLLFVLCLVPLGWLVGQAATGGLGANPIEALTRSLGDWALRLLLVSLMVTPLRELAGWAGALRYRRMLGLFAFFYVGLHAASYVGLDQFFAWAAIWADIVKRTYITIGLAALLLLVPLAVTSTHRMVRRLGAVRWKRLHRLVYPASVLAVVHFLMMVKADATEPAIYGAVLATLLAVRVVVRLRRRARRAERRADRPGAWLSAPERRAAVAGSGGHG